MESQSSEERARWEKVGRLVADAARDEELQKRLREDDTRIMVLAEYELSEADRPYLIDDMSALFPEASEEIQALVFW